MARTSRVVKVAYTIMKEVGNLLVLYWKGLSNMKYTYSITDLRALLREYHRNNFSGRSYYCAVQELIYEDLYIGGDYWVVQNLLCDDMDIDDGPYCTCCQKCIYAYMCKNMKGLR